MKEEHYGALYESADASARVGQTRFLRATRIRLFGLVVAAVGGAFTLDAGRIELFGTVSLLAFTVALASELFVLIDKPERLWYEGRAAAESVKTLVWRFMMGADPFPLDRGDDEVTEAYLGRLRELLRDLSQLGMSPASSAELQITEQMLEARHKPLHERKVLYELGRVEDQRGWYARKAQWNAARAVRWSVAAVALELGGVIGAALKAFQVTEIDVLGLLAAAAAGVAGWGQAKQFRALSRAYFVASQELATIRSQVHTDLDEGGWNEFVQDAEGAISREHTLWRASRVLGLGPP